jgi:hypothetical protein
MLKPKLFRKSPQIIGLSTGDLLRTYSEELQDIVFEDNEVELKPILQKVGENAEVFLHNFPNTTSREKIVEEVLTAGGLVRNRTTRTFNYLFLHRESNQDAFDETRLDSKGRDAKNEIVPGFFRTTGFAACYVFFRSHNQRQFHFRYLGRQQSQPRAYLIAFEQDVNSDLLGTFNRNISAGADFALIVYQGLLWVDPATFHLSRVAMNIAGILAEKPLDLQIRSDVQFSEITFPSLMEPFWLPAKVKVQIDWNGVTYRNRHAYTDYRVFSVESYEKRERLIKRP